MNWKGRRYATSLTSMWQGCMVPGISNHGPPRTRTEPYLIWSKCQIWRTQLQSFKIAMKSGSSYLNTNICQEKKDDRSGKESKKNCWQRRPPSSPRELGKRENITHRDGIMRGYISSTRFAKNGRNYQVRTRKVHGNNWRWSGINTLKTTTPCISTEGVGRENQTIVRTLKICHHSLRRRRQWR